MPLKQNVSIYSGIAPPPALLERLTNGRPGSLQHIDSDLSASNIPPPALNSNSPQASAASGPSMPAPPYDEPPPSYEDAMADNLTPANGIRPGYRPPDPNTQDTRGIWRDEKG
jgi:hypothetical protein